MKKVFFLCFLLAFQPAYGVDKKACLTDINQLEAELKNCTVSYDDNASTADMNNATYDATDCAIRVMDKVFEKYYSNTLNESKALFNQLVKSVYAYAHHLQQSSDYARVHYLGTMYNTMAISTADKVINDFVQSYLDEIKAQCKDYD